MAEPKAPHPLRPATTADHPAAAAPTSTYTPDTDVHILDRLAVLYRYRRVAIAVFILTTVAMMIQGYSSIQMYRAQARLLIEDERATAVPGITTAENTYYEDPDLYYKTQYRILKGRDLARRVVKRVNLGAVPEFNGTAQKPSTPATLLHDLKQKIVGLVRPAPAPENTESPKVDETADESALVSAFLSRVDVAPVSGSKLVDVTFDSMDRRFAATAANTLVDEFVDQNLQVKLQSTENMIDWLDKELDKQQQKVQDSERGLAEPRARAAEQAERRRDDGAQPPHPEGNAVQPDQVGVDAGARHDSRDRAERVGGGGQVARRRDAAGARAGRRPLRRTPPEHAEGERRSVRGAAPV